MLLFVGFGPISGQSWARDRYQRPRLEKWYINQRKLSRETDFKVVWVPEGSLAGFVGDAFLRSGRPRGPGKALKNVLPLTLLKAFPGPRGRPDLKNTSHQETARLPSSTQGRPV